MIKVLFYKLLTLAAFNHPTYIPPEEVLNDPAFANAVQQLIIETETSHFVYFGYIDRAEAFREVKKKYNDLKNCPHFREADSLPSREWLNDRLDFLKSCRFHLEKVQAIHWNKEHYDNLIMEIKKLESLTDMFCQARWYHECKFYYECRTQLREIRNKIGYDNYYTQQWPVFTPLHLFYEIE